MMVEFVKFQPKVGFVAESVACLTMIKKPPLMGAQNNTRPPVGDGSDGVCVCVDNAG